MYVYIGIFFALLCAVFKPTTSLIRASIYEDMTKYIQYADGYMIGFFSIIIGLIGVILLYKCITNKNVNLLYFYISFLIIIVSLLLIYIIGNGATIDGYTRQEYFERMYENITYKIEP